MTESAGKFISPFMEEGLQQLEPDENAAFTMPDISLFNDSLDDSYHAKALGLTAEANESAVASKSGADLDDSLCMQEEGTETPAHENELDNTLLDDPIEDGLQVDMAVVPKPSPEGKLSVSLSKHIIPDHLGYHTDDTSQGDHTAAEKECTCKDDGNTGPTTGKAAANDKKVVPSFGRPRKGVTTPKAQAPTAKKTSRALTSPSAGSTSANQTPAKSAAPVESDSGTKPDELGQGETDHAEADKDSSALSVTSRPQKPKFGPSKCKKLSANSTSRSAPKKTVSKVRPDKQVELDQGHEMKSQFGPPKCKATGNPKSATSESSIKGEDKSASKAERKAEQKRKKEEREAKKQEKEQQKQEKDKKRAEKQQQKEEKRLEQERKKAEREQKKMEKEIKKIERDQKKVQKETTGQQQKKKAQPKTAKGNGEHDSDGISVSKSPTRPSNDDTDDSSNGAATEILTQAPPGLGSDEERNPEPICGSAKVTTSEDKPQMHQQDSSNSSPKAPSEPRLTSLSGNSPQQSEAAAPSVTAAQVSSAEEDTTEMGDIPGPGKSTGDGEQTEQNVATNQEDNAGDAGNASLVQQESEDSTDKDMEGGNNVASPRRLPDASLNETATKENIKPNSCVNAKPSSKVEPRGGKDCQVSLQKLQVKTASVKSKRPGSGHKRALNRPTVSPKAHRKPPASKRESTRQPSRKRKAVESVSSGSDSHTSDPDSKPPRKKQQRSAPTNYSGPVWVQCERTECQKWRQLRDCLDPSKVPSQWECSMNTDPAFSSCSAPEEQWSDLGESQEYVESPFVPGSIVWARMGGYPWWPAMVEEDPDEETYYEMSDSFCTIPVKYHVVFFDTPVCRAWIPSGLIWSFEGNADMNELNRVNVPQKYRRSLKQAMKRSERALTMTVKERLTEFAFSKRYRKTSGSRKRVAKVAVADHAFRSSGGSRENPKPGSRKSARLRATSTEPEMDGDHCVSGPHGGMAMDQTNQAQAAKSPSKHK